MIRRKGSGRQPAPVIKLFLTADRSDDGLHGHRVRERPRGVRRRAGRFVYNPIGSVHGGWYATILDSALGCAIHTALPAGKIYTTVDLNITFLRALTEQSGSVRCEGKIIHFGGSIATAEGRITGKDGTLYATGTTTCLVMTPR